MINSYNSLGRWIVIGPILWMLMGGHGRWWKVHRWWLTGLYCQPQSNWELGIRPGYGTLLDLTVIFFDFTISVLKFNKMMFVKANNCLIVLWVCQFSCTCPNLWSASLPWPVLWLFTAIGWLVWPLKGPLFSNQAGFNFFIIAVAGHCVCLLSSRDSGPAQPGTICGQIWALRYLIPECQGCQHSPPLIGQTLPIQPSDWLRPAQLWLVDTIVPVTPSNIYGHVACTYSQMA